MGSPWDFTCCKMQIWKERLNSDGQQFHQYEHNEQQPLSFKSIPW